MYWNLEAGILFQLHNLMYTKWLPLNFWLSQERDNYTVFQLQVFGFDAGLIGQELQSHVLCYAALINNGDIISVFSFKLSNSYSKMKNVYQN